MVLLTPASQMFILKSFKVYGFVLYILPFKKQHYKKKHTVCTSCIFDDKYFFNGSLNELKAICDLFTFDI